MLKIGDFSSICQVTIKTLRYYDRLGLLKPAHVDKFTGHRYYSMHQITRLNRILALKALGLSLDDIKQVLDDSLSIDAIQNMLRVKEAELRADITATQMRLQGIQNHIDQLKEEGTMPTYDVIVKALPPQRVLSIREGLDTSEDISDLIAEISEALKAHKITPTGAYMSICHHEGFKDTALDIEIAVPVAMSVKDDISLGEGRSLTIRQTTAHAQVASVIENGHNTTWSGSYTALGHFIETHNYEMAGAVREVYLTSPDDPDGWLVEIQFPVQKIAQPSAT